ncbi:hypothetical protein LAZ67_4003055 [Cordylochernes scorpioides]|uniref:Integrase catalytic domain-containing protein n=1 Tax=Cordylochernes scorpioides TaxID=51811 RepID=A0ABY6KDJ0_9ARAC|nr:hypothetical protein LAZ67_4003055 [Cordylochernes scorpioides]
MYASKNNLFDTQVQRYHRLLRPKSQQDCGRQGKQVDHCLYRKMEQGREEDSKESMESDPDYESGENTTSPRMENTLGSMQEVAPSQEDATPSPAVSDVLVDQDATSAVRGDRTIARCGTTALRWFVRSAELLHQLRRPSRSGPTTILYKTEKATKPPASTPPSYQHANDKSPPPQQPFDLISIDTITGFSKYRHSKTYLHVIVDHLTRYAWAFPSKSTSTLTYIQTLKKVLQQGSPKRLLSDRAPAFTSEKFRKFLLSRGIQPLLTTSNNPQANGLIERLNATITGKLRLLYLENPRTSWTKLIKQAVQFYNQSPHTVIGFPPIFLMFNSVLPELKTHYNPFPDVQKARQLAFSRTQLKHERDKQRYDKGHQTPHFEIGDLVLVKNYKHPNTGKLAPYFTGWWLSWGDYCRELLCRMLSYKRSLRASVSQSLANLCFSTSPPDAPIKGKPFPARNLLVPFLLDVQTLLSGISVCLFHLWPSCVAFHHDCSRVDIENTVLVETANFIHREVNPCHIVDEYKKKELTEIIQGCPQTNGIAMVCDNGIHRVHRESMGRFKARRLQNGLQKVLCILEEEPIIARNCQTTYLSVTVAASPATISKDCHEYREEMRQEARKTTLKFLKENRRQYNKRRNTTTPYEMTWSQYSGLSSESV